MLEVLNLSCGYKDKTVVKSASFSVGKGETVALTGPNGCGKTTLLRALCGIIPYTGGSAKIDGKEISLMKREELSERAALLLQTGVASEYSDFTAEETVLLGRYARQKSCGSSPADIAAAEEYMEKTDILPLRDSIITQLSGGQLQRVMLARAFAQEPSVIFLDEPANHLDLRRQIELIYILKDCADSGKTVVGVFHDLNLAAAFSDRIIVMADGKIAADGGAREICRSQKLSEIYGFDIRGYMLGSLSKWN